MLKKSMEKALEMLEENRERMEKVAELLLEKETITSVDMEEICGPRRGRKPSGYSQIVRDVQKNEAQKKEKKMEEEEEEKRKRKEEQEETKKEEETQVEKEKTKNEKEKEEA